MKKSLFSIFIGTMIFLFFSSVIVTDSGNNIWVKAFKNSADKGTLSLNKYGKFILWSDYPKQPVKEINPSWKKYDFKDRNEYKDYMKEVLFYFLNQNVKGLKKEDWFKQHIKKKHIWYHAPSLSWKTSKNLGREYINGLTRERSIRKDEWKISTITDLRTNWAIGFYNSTAAYTLGKTWDRKIQRILPRATFEENSVIVKLIYTSSSEKELPLVKGALILDANIILSKTDTAKSRRIKPVHLIQIDFAVKDSRSGSGWVFGTFVYPGSDRGVSSIKDFNQFIPMGVNWGANSKESLLNREAKNHFGYFWDINSDYKANRLRGPIDNPKLVNCMKCHSEIEVGIDNYEKHNYDYSLQLAKGIQTFNKLIYSGKNDKMRFSKVELNNILLSKEGDFSPSFTSED